MTVPARSRRDLRRTTSPSPAVAEVGDDACTPVESPALSLQRRVGAHFSEITRADRIEPPPRFPGAVRFGLFVIPSMLLWGGLVWAAVALA